MAKKGEVLTFQDIVLGAEVETIQRALEARREIDALLEQREAAYQKIAEVEAQVQAVMGEDGEAFPFPDPPVPVAAWSGRAAPAKKVAKPARPAASGRAEGAAGDAGRGAEGEGDRGE